MRGHLVLMLDWEDAYGVSQQRESVDASGFLLQTQRWMFLSGTKHVKTGIDHCLAIVRDNKEHCLCNEIFYTLREQRLLPCDDHLISVTFSDLTVVDGDSIASGVKERVLFILTFDPPFKHRSRI